MAIDVYWGSGSPYSWRVLLALEHKGLSYNSHLLSLDMQEHKSPHMLALNPRGRVPTLKDGEYVVFESLAVLYYLDRKYPAKPLFGNSPEEGAVIMRVCCEFQAYIEEHVMRIAGALLMRREDPHSDFVTNAALVAAGEARTIEMRLSKGDWIVGDQPGAADYFIYPGIQLLLRALARPEARDLSSRFLPVDANYPALSRWMKRIESLPGYERTYPPHWRNTPR
jgi:glutathione S-transferase